MKKTTKVCLTWLDFVYCAGLMGFIISHVHTFKHSYFYMARPDLTWFDFEYCAGLMNFIAVESGGRILIVATNLIFCQFKIFNKLDVFSVQCFQSKLGAFYEPNACSVLYHCHALNHLILYYRQRYIHKKTHKLYRMFTERLIIYTMFTKTVAHSSLV